MARQATGQVVERERKGGTVYALRFRAYGSRHYVTLGSTADGWNRRKAEAELTLTLAQVERGTWQAPTPAPAAPVVTDPTFHEFASEWFAAKSRELRDKTRVEYGWRLSCHLLPFFARHRLSALTVAEIDRYREHKVRQGVIGHESINKTIGLLGQILDVADERALLERNPVRANPHNRKLTAPTPKRTWIDRADHLAALLDAAGALDVDARRRPGQRRALMATLAFAGSRLGELLDLRWADVDLARGTLPVRHAKTRAGERTVDVLAVLRDERDAYRARMGEVDDEARVFATSSGGRLSESAVRNRILAPAVERADAKLAESGGARLPGDLIPHSLRRTFASILVALGEDPAYVMGQMGHTDPTLTLRIYAQQMRRRDGERDRLGALGGH